MGFVWSISECEDRVIFHFNTTVAKFRKLEGCVYIVARLKIKNWWYLAVNTRIKTIKIKQSNCSNWFCLIVAACFGPQLGTSSGSHIKYVSCYWTVLIWIHISACNRHEVARIFIILKFSKFDFKFKIIKNSLVVECKILYCFYIFVTHCTLSFAGVRCYILTIWK
jgi:hypothetical protein